MNFLRQLRVAPRALAGALRACIADELERQRLAHVTFGSGVILRGSDRMRAGRGVFLDHRAYLSASSVDGGRGYIRLGDYVEVGPYAVLWGGGGIEIGNNVHLGAHVHVTSQAGRPVPPEQNDPQLALPVDVAPVRIEDHVLIYSGAILVPGVTIGHHAVVGAGSVVIDDIPPYATAVGAPARVVSARAS